MARLSLNDAYVGITTPLSEFAHDGRYGRSCPDVRVSYLDTSGNRQIVNICPHGARTLSKALKTMADKADPPRKKSS